MILLKVRGIKLFALATKIFAKLQTCVSQPSVKLLAWIFCCCQAVGIRNILRSADRRFAAGTGSSAPCRRVCRGPVFLSVKIRTPHNMGTIEKRVKNSKKLLFQIFEKVFCFRDIWAFQNAKWTAKFQLQHANDGICTRGHISAPRWAIDLVRHSEWSPMYEFSSFE